MISINDTIRTSRMEQLVAAIDADASAGYVSFYDSTRPASGAAITTEVLLGTCLFADTSGTVTAGVLSFADLVDDLDADNTGTVTWARLSDGAGVFVADMDCGLVGSGAEFIFNDVSISSGGLIHVASTATITDGNA